jgi:rubrerythrin
MVKKISREEKNIFICEVCGFGYIDEETASDCENFCSANNMCSIEITKKAIYYPE